jgi:amino-acid N-acetyltransferase
MDELYIRKATVQDVKTIHGMLMQLSKQGYLLPRSYTELYSHLRDFFVLAPVEKGPILGCCALSITWENLAEIRSLGVAEELRGRGWGKRLVEACLSEAVTLGFFRIFTLTYKTAFFEKVGFVEVSKDVLPQKVWSECIKCPKFPECDEIAMLLEL